MMMGRKRHKMVADPVYANAADSSRSGAGTGTLMTGFPEEVADVDWDTAEMPDEPEACELCEREDLELTRHHLIPRKQHNKPRTKKLFSRDEMRCRIAWLCRDCHGHIHTMFTEKELAWQLNTLEDLRNTTEMEKFLSYIRKRR